MAIYFTRDIEQTFDGDLGVDPKGDLALAGTRESHVAAVNFILRTDRSDYQPDRRVGANLGSYIGETNNRETHDKMEFSITRAITDGVYSKEDLLVAVVPTDCNEAAAVIQLQGTYVQDGKQVADPGTTLTYRFPYIAGELIPVI